MIKTYVSRILLGILTCAAVVFSVAAQANSNTFASQRRASASCDVGYSRPASSRSDYYIRGTDVREVFGDSCGVSRGTLFDINLIAYFDPDINSSYHQLRSLRGGSRCTTGWKFFNPPSGQRIGGVILGTPTYCTYQRSAYPGTFRTGSRLKYLRTGGELEYVAGSIEALPNR